MISLLVVDDSALMRKLLGKIFAAEADFTLRFAKSGLDALAQIALARPDVVTLDINMPEMDGLACLDRIMVETPVPVVMVSALTAAGAAVTFEALKRGAVDFVPKPSGAISLEIEALTAALVEKVRGAALARLRGSLRLKERVRHRIGSELQGLAKLPPARRAAAAGEGLVLVGTSTGGPPALEALLAPLPANFPWPVVVAQHMPASFTGPLASRLDGLCALRICEVRDIEILSPGCVYIAHGDADLVVEMGAAGILARTVPSDLSYPWHPSVDRMVRSAMAVVAPENLLGVLMTGMGTDGAQAMADLQAAGGQTIAEDEETAVVWGMPGALVRAGGAQFVLPLPEIAARLRQMVPQCR